MEGTRDRDDYMGEVVNIVALGTVAFNVPSLNNRELADVGEVVSVPRSAASCALHAFGSL